MAVKDIRIDALAVGMFVVRLDRPWPQDSNFASLHRIRGQRDITWLKAYGVRVVTIDPTLGGDVADEPLPDLPPAPVPLAGELDAARNVRAAAMATMEGVFEGVATGVPIDSEAVKSTVRNLMATILRCHDPLVSLIHSQQHDLSQLRHAVHTGVLALVVGKHQGMRKAALEHLGVGALLHDLGEQRLPRNLLHKAGVYTASERRLLQRHPTLGAVLLEQAGDLHQEARRIVLEHHERIDGSGYPAGLKDGEISPLSEIVGIVDVYDSMLDRRPGRPRLSPAQAVKELYQEALKGHMSRPWVERIIQCFGIYPVGSLVELSTGERGVVTASNPLDALRPTVRIIPDATRQPSALPKLVNLAVQAEPEPPRTILRTLDPEKENLGSEAFFPESH